MAPVDKSEQVLCYSGGLALMGLPFTSLSFFETTKQIVIRWLFPASRFFGFLEWQSLTPSKELVLAKALELALANYHLCF